MFRRVANVVAVCALLTGAAVTPAQAAPDPIGPGWTEIFPKSKLDQPPGKNRHELINGEHHMWVLNTDPSTYPGRDSGPRSEFRFYNDYKTGQAQFQADIKIKSGCSRASVMQIFGATTQSTAFMAWTIDNKLTHYSGGSFYSPVHDKYLTLNVVHDTGTGKVSVYVNRALRGTFQDHGRTNHYFKAGVYHQKGMSGRCDVYLKNIHMFQK